MSNVSRRQHGERYLVKQRLKSVMIATVDNGYIYRKIAQRHRRVESTKSRTDNNDARASSVIAGVERFC